MKNIYLDLQKYLTWCKVNNKKPQNFESLKDFNQEVTNNENK